MPRPDGKAPLLLARLAQGAIAAVVVADVFRLVAVSAHDVHPTDASLTDTGGSFTVTYWPSEFSQVRGQYRRTNYGTAPLSTVTANELLFQFQFSIGAHGAHPF